MTRIRALLALIACASTTYGSRMQMMDLRGEKDAGAEQGAYCCCKRKKCEAGSISDDEASPAVYSPNKDLCCKFKSRACNSWLSFSSYTIEEDESLCKVPEDTGFSNPHSGDAHEIVKVEDLKPGTPAHTIHSYCDFAPGSGEQEEETGEAAAEGDEQNSEKTAVVKAIVTELSKNNLDTMAKEMFSLYVCIRWTPDSDFQSVAAGEIATEQLDNKSVYQHFYDFSFVPLRCSRNVNVYGESAELGKTHYQEFEAEVQALAWWYKNETEGTLNKRLEAVQGSSVAELSGLTGAFDLDRVKRAVAQCSEEDKKKPILVSATQSTTEELLADCAAATWWLEKLQDWHRALPFMTFMSPDDAARAGGGKPSQGDSALICFGKRVASQLHRRENGGHLMTDQSMVGCHGFWDLPTAGRMLERIAWLWRPPTCQLQAMELDVKIKLMESIAEMNTRLFDALPEMLASEIGDVAEDGHMLEASPAMGVMQGMWTSIMEGFSSLSGSYTRLGQLLGNTVVKWVVCPVKTFTNSTEEDLMDMALGYEDDLARDYAKTAYSKWTGEEDLLPGESCEPYEPPPGAPAMPRDSLQSCALGIMQEDMPEPYHEEEFLCPVRPLLPAKQQLDIFKQKEGLCMVHMNSEQMLKEHWYYRGSSPFLKQYNVTENFPHQDYQYFKLLDFKSYRDHFNRMKTSVIIGNGCTEEEAFLTPRWCKEPNVANDNRASTFMNGVRIVTGGLAGGAGAVAGAAGLALQAAGVTEKTPSNSISKDRLGAWLGNSAKSWEQWIRETSNAWAGRAKRRYKRMYEHYFDEVDSAKLLHSAAFQTKIAKTGADSKNRQRFDRFGIVAPCVNFDPNREFHLKYTWSEKALNLAYKAFQKISLPDSRAFKVQVRGEGALHVKSETHAWMTYSSHFRAAKVGESYSSWSQTSNPHLMEMAGVFDTSGAVGAEDLLGFEAIFACGKRVEMHNLPSSFTQLPGSFEECVKDGVVENQNLRDHNPDKPFLKDETVVRVTLAPLSSCFVDVDMAKVQNQNETKLTIFETFLGAKSSCATLMHELPEDLARVKEASDYRGLILGKGLPQETLTEFLVYPADLMMELKF